MFAERFKEALSCLDNIYYTYKMSETGFNYIGLIFDDLLDNCVFGIDYLNINDYINAISGLSYDESLRLAEQYNSLSDEEYAKLFGALLSLLNQSKNNEDKTSLNRICNFFKRNNIYTRLDGEFYIVFFENIIDSGSYADVIYISDTLLKKRLKKIFSNDEKQKKRFKYEYENMQKLSDVDNVLNVYEYNEQEHSYLMEKCDSCLYDYLNSKIINDSVANDLILQVLNALKSIHDRNIIHRDLHLGNLLIKNGNIVISDFGLSKDLDIKRSLTSSDTPKNNNSFIDPVGLSDFTKLDKLSDIYSVGKIMEYILSNNNSLFARYSGIIEKCLKRRRELRYQSVDEILNDVQYILDDEKQKEAINTMIDKISAGGFDIVIKNTIMDLTNKNEIALFIVNNRLFDFGKTFLNFDFVDQEKIAKSIYANFVNATGYNGWNNYDIFTSIAAYIIENSTNSIIISKFYNLLKEIAGIRYNAQTKLDYILRKYPSLKNTPSEG